jgi:hypothetical protein
MNNTTSDTAGLGTVTSKVEIKSVEDALNRISGHRFVMKNVMPGIDASLDALTDKFNKV